MAFHKEQTGLDVHVPHTFTYVDAAARDAVVSRDFIDPDDLFKIARQTSDMTYWVLEQITPSVVWNQLSINSTNFIVIDKNIELGNVVTPTDITADGGGITLLGDTNKTILWLNSIVAWTFNQTLAASGQVVVGALLAPATDASIDLQATDKALLNNRLTTIQRDALTAIAGMVIYNTTTDDVEFYNSAVWQSMSGGDVVGPASSINNAIAIFSGVGGKNIKNSNILVTDEGLDLDRGNIRFQKETFPGAPIVAVNATAGNLNGVYTYQITSVTNSGETQGGSVSSTVNPVNQQVDLSAIPIGTVDFVIARKIYRTVSGGSQHKLVATINDNVTTTFTDNVADGSLGVDVPTINKTAGELIIAGVGSVNVNEIKNHINALGNLTPGSIPFFNGSILVAADLFWDDINNRFGVGTINPQAGMHGVVTNGEFLWADTETDATGKVGRWGVPHFINAEGPFFGIVFVTQTSKNVLIIGGGTGFGNAATEIRFNIAANNTTPTGTSRIVITNDGTTLGSDAVPVVGQYFKIDTGWSVKRKATAVNVGTSDEVIIGVTNTSIARTITIQTADVIDSRMFIIKDESGGAGINNITIATEGAETIDGQTTVTISINFGVVRLYSNGTNLFSF